MFLASQNSHTSLLARPGQRIARRRLQCQALEANPPKEGPKGGKVENSCIAAKPVVTLTVVSPATRSFNIHKDLLCSESIHFRQYFESSHNPEPLVLPDSVTAEVMEAFSCWIYTKSVQVTELEDEYGKEDGSSSSDGDHDDDDDDDDDDASDQEDVSDGQVSVIAIDDAGGTDDGANSDSCAASATDGQNPEGRPWYSSLQRRCRIFGRLLDLYTFATNFFGKDHGVDKSRFAMLPSSFLTEVLVSIFDNQAPREDMDGVPWCDFHNHQDKRQRRRYYARPPRISNRTNSPPYIYELGVIDLFPQA
ncbi:hypothetical protein QBC33DRAFT_622286 [Phialemonium atrogriseum]|uniref:BTB domain-containing protein n=1 Tax=Phialemonium atrogriseum TaxID=1093897 RepID=A0AAJ0FKR0_9PEZI|nr:uncharacterized protein QBC33DRAFT_622286 [Phialemonium atrogriseum]KAK1764340.1 hypothetical protein QBC33DRAFT_622286 [Phialemonium atrogriseum]